MSVEHVGSRGFVQGKRSELIGITWGRAVTLTEVLDHTADGFPEKEAAHLEKMTMNT